MTPPKTRIGFEHGLGAVRGEAAWAKLFIYVQAWHIGVDNSVQECSLCLLDKISTWGDIDG